MLSDSKHKISRKYGVCFPVDNDRKNMQYSRVAFLLAPN
nr:MULTISPECIES: hypothetical protein [unclassified Okeania]